MSAICESLALAKELIAYFPRKLSESVDRVGTCFELVIVVAVAIFVGCLNTESPGALHLSCADEAARGLPASVGLADFSRSSPVWKVDVVAFSEGECCLLLLKSGGMGAWGLPISIFEPVCLFSRD